MSDAAGTVAVGAGARVTAALVATTRRGALVIEGSRASALGAVTPIPSLSCCVEVVCGASLAKLAS